MSKLRDTLEALERHLPEILEHVQKARVDQAEIRKDLNYHIKRTDLLEEKLVTDVALLHDRVRPLTRILNFFQVLGALLVAGAAIAAILRLFLPQ